MAIDKLIPQYLNKDEDSRLIKAVEMSDALNVRVSHEADGDRGVIKNILGNTAVEASGLSDAYPSGSNRVVGSVASEAGGCIYYFLYNSNNDHGIYKYSHATNTYSKVYQNSALNFKYDSFVKADVIINQFSEHLLYFTDNINEPRKINATKALSNNYDSGINNADYADNYLSVCKPPPQTPITFEFTETEGVSSNALKNNCFQFAYQYVYDDGEVSALSQYSELAVSPTNLAHNVTTQSFFETQNNTLRLTVKGLEAPIDKIRIYARRNNEGAFFRINEIDHTVGTQVIDFRNDGIYTFLSDQESGKLYDSVPRKAAAQAISNNRLFYGNYLEGFDNINTRGRLTPIYNARPETGDMPTAVGEGMFADGSGPGLYQNTNDEISDMYKFLIGKDYYQSDILTNSSTLSTTLHGFGLDNGDPSIEIDLSDFIGTSFLDEGNILFSTSLSCDSLGIGTFGDMVNDTVLGSDAFKLDIPIVDSTGGLATVAHPGSTSVVQNTQPNPLRVNVLTPFKQGPSFGHTAQGPRGTGIHFLVPTTPIHWENNFQIPALNPNTDGDIAATIGQHIIDNVNNQVTSVHLHKKSTTFGDGLDGYNAVGTVTDTTAQYDSDIDNIVYLHIEGNAEFQLYSGTFFYDGAVPKVRFLVRLTDVDFQVQKMKGDFTSTVDINGDTQANVIDYYNAAGTIGNTTLGGVDYDSGINSFDGIGEYIHDFTTTNGRGIRTAYLGLNVVQESVEYTPTSSSGSLSYKAGASHEFGVVYFDAKNRPSAVHKIDSVDVAHFGTEDRRGNEGATDVDLRLHHAPPYWAKKWAPVYSKNTTYEKVLHVSVLEAALAKTTTYTDPLGPIESANTRPITSALSSGTQGVIYLSMRGLEGKSNSYKESKGALVSYEYKEGDMLRVIECLDSNGNKIRPLSEFPISSYEYFGDDDKNPITLSNLSADAEENSYRRTGWFLGIRDEDITNFNRDSVGDGADYFSNDCIVEIYRPKSKVEDQVFYEVGKVFDIVENGGYRTHGGDRSNTDTATGIALVLGLYSFSSVTRFYIGDTVIFPAPIGGIGGTYTPSVTITGIQPLPSGEYKYFTNIAFSSVQMSGTFNVYVPSVAGDNSSVWPGVVTLPFGDVYLRRRELLSNVKTTTTQNDLGGVDSIALPDETKPSEQYYKTYFIEDESVSDFFDSKAVAIGRAHIEMPDQAEIQRLSSVTYSDPFALDSSRLNLSSFNPSLFPFKDYNTQHGAICYIIDNNETLMVLQENKVSSTPIGRTLIEDAGGGQLVTSMSVMGTEVFFGGDYGPGLQPESVVESFGKVYFCDVSRGAVVEIASKGIMPISATNMDSYFNAKFSSLNSVAQVPRIPCGIDPDNNEYIVTTQALTKNTLSVPAGDGGELSAVEKSSTTTYNDAVGSIVYRQGGSHTWDVLFSNFQLDGEEWGNSGNGSVVIDRLAERGSVVIDSALRDSISNTQIAVTTSDGSLAGVATISLKDGSLELPSSLTRQSDGASVSLTKSSANAATAETVAYSTLNELWLTFYSFYPELYERLHDRFFSFYNGVMYRHNVNATRNNFYGTQYDSKVTVVSRANPSDIKVYDAMSLEGDSAWKTVVSNSNQSTGTEAMLASTFDKREGLYYRQIAKDATANSTSNTSHKVVLGEISSITDDKIVFTSKISNLPFGIGDKVFKLETALETDTTLTISAITGRKEVQLSATVSGLNVGDTVMAVSDNDINGDKLRDYYAQAVLTNDSTGAVELFAVNMVYKSSPSHNNTSQQK